jgi:hypothetical protein
MQSCKGYCEEYKSLIARYHDGTNKRCQVCELFMSYPGKRCPCCKSILRTKNHLYGRNKPKNV